MTLCFMPVELGLQLLSIILVSMLLVLPTSVHFDLCFDTRSLYFAHSCQHSISLHFDVPSLSFILFLCSKCSRFKVCLSHSLSSIFLGLFLNFDLYFDFSYIDLCFTDCSNISLNCVFLSSCSDLRFLKGVLNLFSLKSTGSSLA